MRCVGKVTDYAGAGAPRRKARRALGSDHLLMYQRKGSKGASQAAKTWVQAVYVHNSLLRAPGLSAGTYLEPCVGGCRNVWVFILRALVSDEAGASKLNLWRVQFTATEHQPQCGFALVRKEMR